MKKAEHLRKMIALYAMRTGEELKRGLPAVVREAYQSKCWQDVVKPDGSKYSTFREWLETPPPPGCGLSQPGAIAYDEFLSICEVHAPDVATVLAAERGKGKRGGDKRSAKAKEQTPARENDSCGNPHTRRPTLAARLQREKPEFYRGFLDGTYRSLRSAAEAAKIVQPGHDPLMRLKSYWKKATKKQRSEFLKWTESDQGSR